MTTHYDRNAWIDAYISTMSRAMPQAKPSAVTAMAHAAWEHQGWVYPGMAAYLDAELGAYVPDPKLTGDVQQLPPRHPA